MFGHPPEPADPVPAKSRKHGVTRSRVPRSPHAKQTSVAVLRLARGVGALRLIVGSITLMLRSPRNEWTGPPASLACGDAETSKERRCALPVSARRGTKHASFIQASDGVRTRTPQRLRRQPKGLPRQEALTPVWRRPALARSTSRLPSCRAPRPAHGFAKGLRCSRR